MKYIYVCFISVLGFGSMQGAEKVSYISEQKAQMLWRQQVERDAKKVIASWVTPTKIGLFCAGALQLLFATQSTEYVRELGCSGMAACAVGLGITVQEYNIKEKIKQGNEKGFNYLVTAITAPKTPRSQNDNASCVVDYHKKKRTALFLLLRPVRYIDPETEEYNYLRYSKFTKKNTLNSVADLQDEYLVELSQTLQSVLGLQKYITDKEYPKAQGNQEKQLKVIEDYFAK